MSAGVSIVVTVGTDTIGPAVARLLAAAEDLTPVMEEIGSYLELSVDLRFEGERGPGGAAWKPSRRARQEAGTTLSDTGRLRASITSEAGPDFVRIGTNVIYAAIHQEGGTIIPKQPGGRLTFPIGDGWVSVNSVTLPARPFLGLDAEDEGEILGIVGDYLDVEVPA